MPESRADPQPRLIALPVTRIRTRSDHPREPIFILQGVPGATNMTFDKVSRYEHDVILVGYRGVDGSVRLDCPEVEAALQHTADLLSENTSRAYANAYRSCTNRLSSEGLDLGSYGVAQQVTTRPTTTNDHSRGQNSLAVKGSIFACSRLSDLDGRRPMS